MRIGFIGQGYIGKNYADDFERRGFDVVRYALEEEYRDNKEKIKDCDIVFIAVPTPTTPEGFDVNIVREALGLVGAAKIAVIKSTLMPGTTEMLQGAYSDRVVLASPEFLNEATAAHDAAHPFSNIVGMPSESKMHQDAAALVHSVLPKASYTLTCSSTEAEIIKYTHNGSGYVQVIFFNLMYDLAKQFGYGWENIGKAIEADPLVSNTYAKPVHKSGRGAGGHCFIKDFAVLRELYEKTLPGDAMGAAVLEALEKKNIELLRASGKDITLLEGVYGTKSPSS